MPAVDQNRAAEDAQSADLLALARQLRDAAVRAGRPDVVAKVDEVIATVVPGTAPDGGTTASRDGDDKPNTIIKVLDGLGF